MSQFVSSVQVTFLGMWLVVLVVFVYIVPINGKNMQKFAIFPHASPTTCQTMLWTEEKGLLNGSELTHRCCTFLNRTHFCSQFDYTGVEPGSQCYSCSNSNLPNCVCNLNFTISTLFKVSLPFSHSTHTNSIFNYLNRWTLNWLCFPQQGPVFFYYSLSNYFQNHRKYGVSKDDNQLFGDLTYFAVS